MKKQKKNQFYRFSILPICSGSSQRYRDKIEAGVQLQAFPFPTILRSRPYSNAFMAKWRSQTLSFKSVMDKKQTHNQNT